MCLFFSRNFTAVEQYYESIRSSPATPHDDAKVPRKSILKPDCVPSPINPFYYPDGRRKLAKRKSRN